MKWSELKIFKIGAPPLPDSCLPHGDNIFKLIPKNSVFFFITGMKPEDHLTKLVPITPSPSILHNILAVSFAEKEEEDVILSHVAGFVCV